MANWRKFKSSADRVQAKISGEFNIPILKVDQSGENLDPNKPAATTTSRKRPFEENQIRAQQNEVAKITAGQNKNALYRAATSTIGGEKAYVMREMEKNEGAAKKIKGMIIKHKKKKGTYLSMYVLTYHIQY